MQFDFENCTNEDAVRYKDNGDDDSNCKKDIDEEIDQSKFLDLSLHNHLYLCALVLQSSLFILCK